jgi:hypothetical protein
MMRKELDEKSYKYDPVLEQGRPDRKRFFGFSRKLLDFRSVQIRTRWLPQKQVALYVAKNFLGTRRYKKKTCKESR